jgi:magnesium chelatase family protein
VVTRYQKRLSGPILDRIDMHLGLERVDMDELTADVRAEPSAVIRQRVIAARKRQWRRFAEHPSVSCNAEMRVREIREFCQLDAAGTEVLREALARLGLSARAYHRVLRVARTIGDLAESEEIQARHVAEAIQYQPRGRPLW